MTDTPQAGIFQLGDRCVKRMDTAPCNWPARACSAPPKDRDGAFALLREAVDSGVDRIDTSDFYGPHVANQIIDEALHPYVEDRVIVTKPGPRRGEDGSWNPAFSKEDLTRAMHDNLRNLGVDALDVVNLRLMFDVHGPAGRCSDNTGSHRRSTHERLIDVAKIIWPSKRWAPRLVLGTRRSCTTRATPCQSRQSPRRRFIRSAATTRYFLAAPISLR